MFILGEGVVAHPMFVHPLYVCMPPYICMPPVCLYAPIHLYAPWGYTHTPRGPHASMLLHGFGTLHVVGGLFFCFICIGTHHPYLGVPPPLLHPHTPLLVLRALLFSGISVLMWAFPLLLKGLGVFPHHWGRLG